MNKVCVILYGALANQLFMIFTAISKALDDGKDYSIYPLYENRYKFYFTSLLNPSIYLR